MKKRILAAVVAAASVLSLTGCNPDNTSSGAGNSGTNSGTNSGDSNSSAPAAELKDDGDCLTILTWGANSDYKGLIEQFCKEAGVDESKVKAVTCGEKGQDAAKQYKEYLKTKEDADIMMFDADFVADYINDDTLTVDYSALGLSKSDFPDAYAYTLSFGTNDAGVFKAASFQATPGGFVYRSDLAEQYLGVKTPAEMQAKISDWTKFQETGKELAQKSENKCSLAATEGGLWQVFQSNRTQPWVVDGKLVMDNAEGFYAIAKGMKDDKSLADVPQWDKAWYAAVKDGTALGDFVPTWGLANNGTSILNKFATGQDADGSAATDVVTNMAICEGPSGWFWGGTYLGVAPKCDNKSLAKQFIEFYCKNETSMESYAKRTGDFVNNKKVIEKLTPDMKHVLLNNQNHYEILSKVLDSLDLNNKLSKYDVIIKDDFNASVQGYLKGDTKTVEEAIKAFKTTVAGHLKDVKVE